MSYNLKLKRCDLTKCKAMCCYDGVYLEKGEEEKIREIVQIYPDYFQHLPKDFIVDGKWKGVADGRKTATRPYNYNDPEYPKHFEQTRCVFATKDHLCSLQIASTNESTHHWDFKPQSCWKFPLQEENNHIKPPVFNKENDPYNLGTDYPGYASFTECGKYKEDGEQWNLVLREEIDYFSKNKDD
ncbi:DUF3109 family protein [Priestia megaterium]|uniref:DUF3109 family protein n=1 Tax=Priestia megaterium TaxID=1404 RepID=A0A6M6DYF3_PRIMG|nr:DUF3109 family protein [Priestia megaterium]QJX79983.1 DUF3109 family protein [Priestia megaterium]